MGQLEVIITGICAVTPGLPSSGQQVKGTKLQVVMPASQRRRTRGKQAGDAVIPVHVPFLSVAVGDITTLPSRAWDYRVDANDGTQLRYVWILNRERVTTSADADDVVKFTRVVSTPGEEPANGAEEPDVYWLADMRRIWPDRSVIRAECLNPAKPPAEVAAQLVLNGGLLASYFATGEKRYVIEVLPKRGGSLVRQVLARKLTAQLPFGGNTLTLNFRSLDNPREDLGSVRIDSGTGNVTIIVGNVTFPDVIEINRDISVGEIHKGRDNHFELYYDILEVNDPKDLDLPAPVRPLQGAHHNCPPLMTE